MFCEMEHLRRMAAGDMEHTAALITCEFASGIDSEEVDLCLRYWRTTIQEASDERLDYICTLNRGNVIVLIKPERFNSFEERLKGTSILSSCENRIELLYSIKTLDAKKILFLLSFL